MSDLSTYPRVILEGGANDGVILPVADDVNQIEFDLADKIHIYYKRTSHKKDGMVIFRIVK